MNAPFKKTEGDLLPAKWCPKEVSPLAVDPLAGKRAAIYSRYSHLGERESSIERQVEGCTAYIEEKGYVVTAVYADRQRTGTNKDREELVQFLEDAKTGMFDLLVVEDIDRLGRALEVTVEIWAELKRLQIEIHDTENGKLSPSQVGSKAGTTDEERTKIVKRNRLGKRLKAKGGDWVGIVSFGYHRVLEDPKSAKTKIVKKPDEAALVLEMFELFDKGVSPDRIAQIFNLRPPEERGHRYWTGREIRGSRKYGSGYLRRLRYAGYSVHGRNTVTKVGKIRKVKPNARSKWAIGKFKDPNLTIVEFDLFDRVQDRLDREGVDRTEPRWTVNHYPLQGLLRCANCGGGMTPCLKRADGKPRVMCNIARNKGSVRPDQKGCDNGRSTALEQVDEMVREVICQEVGNPIAFEAFVKEYNVRRSALAKADETERPALERRLEDLKKEQNDLWNGRLSTIFSDDWLEEKGAELKNNVAATKSRLEFLKAAPKGNLKLDRSATGAIAQEVEELFDGKFDAKTATGAKVVASLRRLVKKVVVDITDEATSVEIHCSVAAVTGNSDSNDVVHFNRTGPRMGSLWESSKTEVRRVDRLVEQGVHAISDAEWARIGPLLPDCVGTSKRGNSVVSPRMVIDAALLHLNEGVPLARMPAVFGDQDAMLAALKRLSSSGGWDMAVEVLREIAPRRIPVKTSEMFSTTAGRYSSALLGLPEIRARHGVEAAAGKFAPTDAEWNLVSDLVPEQTLMVDKEPARITPREFLHAILYMLKSGTAASQMPLRFGSERYLIGSIQRLVAHGLWDKIVERFENLAPDVLAGADLSRFNLYRRSPRQSTVWRRAIAKAADLAGVPDHAPTDAEWNLIKHLFPLELLYVNDVLAVDSPRLLAHALLYRVKEKIPTSSFPPFFGDDRLLQLTITKFVFHHLWEETVSILKERSPETLKDADLGVFSKYKRGRTRRYAHLLPSVEPAVPLHAPSDEHWALVQDLIPPELLVIGGRPAIMEPRKFLHAILYMVAERNQFGVLPKHFGSPDDIRFAMRKLIRHHLWDTMITRFRHFDPDWASGRDFTLFDKILRSKNEQPDFRKHRVRKAAKAVVIGFEGGI